MPRDWWARSRRSAIRRAPSSPRRARPVMGVGPMTIERETRGVSMRRRLISAAIVAAIPLVLWNVAPPEGLSATGWRIAILLAAAAVAWLLEPIPDFAVAMLLAATWTA